jgi:WD40 repeat protein
VTLGAVVVTLMSATIALSGCGGGHASQAPLESGTIIVFDSNQLWLLDPSTADLTPYMQIGEEGVTRIVSVAISPDSRFIYAIVGPCKPDCNWGIEIDQPAQLIQIDTESLETHEMFTYPGLFALGLSPDGQRAVLRYFREDGYYPGFCVLDISQGRCEHGELSVSDVYWVDSRRFVTGEGNVGLVVVNAETLESRPLQVVSATSFDHIPGTQQILFVQSDRGALSFFTINVNTLQTSRQPYTVKAYSIHGLQISPDGRYYLFHGRSPDDIALAELDSGEIIAEIDSMRAAVWMPDSQGLVLLRHIEHDVHPIVIRLLIGGRSIEIPLRRSQHSVYYPVELFDLETRQSEVLHTFDEPVGVVAVP